MKIGDARAIVGHMLDVRKCRHYRWMELSRWICPYRGIFHNNLTDSQHRRDDRELLRFTHIASQAVLRGASGMTSGMTPRNISWFQPVFLYPEMIEAEGAREWLDRVDGMMKDCLSAGGFYQAIQSFNIDLLWAGCALLFAEKVEPVNYSKSEDNILRYECPQIGTWAVATTMDGQLEAVARRGLITAADMEATFGKASMSESAQRELESNPHKLIPVWHLARAEKTGDFPIGSWRWEEGSEDKFLQVSGYHEMPYFFTCWHEGVTPYGTGPGDEALADARQIDIMERRKLEGLSKLTDPPMAAPTSMKGHVNVSNGAINYLPDHTSKISPIIDLGSFAASLGHLREEIATVAQRIEQSLMANIFSSVSMDQRPRDMSATEFLERKREALQQLGPVISAYEPNVLTPLLFRTVQTLDRAGKLGMPPKAFANMEDLPTKMDFISPMANALRQTGAETTRALFMDVSNILKVVGDRAILDKIDMDQMIDELATGIGVKGSVIRSDEEVAQIRQQRAQAEAMQQQMQQKMQEAQLGEAQASAYQQQADAAMAMDEAGMGEEENPLAALFGG